MADEKQFPTDGQGLPDYSALENIGLDPVLVAQSNVIVSELADLVAQQQDKAIETRVDLEKLRSLIGIAERVSQDILPVVAQLVNRYATTPRLGDLLGGPFLNLLKQPAIQQLGQDVLNRLLNELRNKIDLNLPNS